MHVSEVYNFWAGTYDTVQNKTRDLELYAARQTLAGQHFPLIVELGCGTGKNTGWLAQQAGHLIGLDYSEQMLALARQKVTAENVTFRQADLNRPWPVETGTAGLISCSLVLEHIEQLDFIFAEAARILTPQGIFFCCELHPYRQYQGSGANFQDENGATIRPDCYLHHLSDYTEAAARNGFQLRHLNEWFDGNDRSGTPRLVSFVFERSAPVARTL
jgi:ubiquinone/menaquinone biosynthesis C-methylase UbiE